MPKKLERVFRDRPLTPEESASDSEVRRLVQMEFPPKRAALAQERSEQADISRSQADQLRSLAEQLVNEWDDFFRKKGPGVGDHDTNAFMKELRIRATQFFGSDFSEQRICGTTQFKPDFYFPDEATIVEVAMSLRNPSNEYERDVLKAVMAQEDGKPVRRLIFLSKPGAIARTSQPGFRAIADWAQRAHGVTIEVYEFAQVAEAVLEPVVEASNT